MFYNEIHYSQKILCLAIQRLRQIGSKWLVSALIFFEVFKLFTSNNTVLMLQGYCIYMSYSTIIVINKRLRYAEAGIRTPNLPPCRENAQTHVDI